jgi:acid phosphatase type 7
MRQRGKPRNNSLSYWAGLLLVLVGFAHSAPAADPILIGAGDIAKCGSRLPNAEATARLLDQFFATNQGIEAVVFTVGDTVYPRGRAREFAECYEPTWGRHKERTRPSVGNHEYGTRGAQPYYDYFGDKAGEAGKGYYSYDLGEWHIIALNSVCKEVGGCGPGSPQYQWLADDLKNNPRPCTLAYMHHPFFSSGKHGSERELRPFFELLYQHGVEVALGGHEHNYERFAPQTPSGDLEEGRGIQQFIVGTGGRELRRVRRPQPNSVVLDRSSYGVLKLTLKPNSYDWEFLPIAGSSFRDTGSRECN